MLTVEMQRLQSSFIIENLFLNSLLVERNYNQALPYHERKLDPNNDE